MTALLLVTALAAPELIDRVAATVNDAPILLSEVQKRAQPELASNVARLKRRGGPTGLPRIERHLCIRVDLEGPQYREHGDYLVFRG